MSQLARLGAPAGSPVAVPRMPLKYFVGSLALVVLSLGCLGLAGWLYLGHDKLVVAADIVFGLGVLSGGIAGTILYRRTAERCAIALFEKGLVITRFGRKRVVPFDEILVFTLREKEQLSNGVRQGLMRTITVRSEEGTISFENLALDGRPDPVGPILQALRARVAETAEARLRSGGSLAGAGWILDAAGFRAKTKAPAVPLAAITEVAVFQEGVSIWSGEDELPFFFVGSGSPNALVLRDVLARRIGERPARAAGGDGLGRVLFEKRPGRTATVAVIVIGVLFAAMGLYLLLAQEGSLFAAVAVLLMGVGFALWAAYAAFSGLRCHEKGLVRRTPFGQRTMLFSDVDRLTYGATRHYHNGVYTGTHISMKFGSDRHPKPIAYGATTRGSEADLELLRDQVAAMVAQRLCERLDREPEIGWTPQARLSRKAVHFRKRKLVGKGEETSAAFEQALRYSIEGGVFHLFAPGQNKSVLDLPCAAENFYPGFLLFRRLASEATSARRA